MAFEALPATGAGSAEAGRVVRASWGEVVRLNFNDHEERLQDVEAAVSFEFRGEWDDATAYNAGDVVTYQGSLYRASESIPVSSPPDTPGGSPTSWVLLVPAGQDGSSDAELDLEAIRRATSGLGVYAGCDVTEDNAGAGLDVDVAAGHIRLTTGAGLLVTAGEVTLDAAHATLSRIDIVWVNTSGTLGKTTGTAATDPVPPTLPSNSVLLASVARTAADNTVVNADITDKRVFTRLPQLIRKTGDESVNNGGSGSTLQDDDVLAFTIAASEVWSAKWVIGYTAGTTEDIKTAFNVPSGATGRVMTLGPGTAVAVTGDGSFFTTTDLTDGTPLAFGGGNSPMAIYDTVVINSTTPGTVKFRFAQNTAGATNTTVHANSYVIATKIG